MWLGEATTGGFFSSGGDEQNFGLWGTCDFSYLKKQLA